MKNRMLSYLAAIPLIVAGCTSQQGKLVTQTSYQRQARELDATTLSGFELRRVTEKDNHYSLEEEVIHGRRYFVENNRFANENEASVVFTRYEDHKRILDSEGGLLRITSDSVFIPKQALNENGEIVTRATFTTTGRYGVKANLREFDTEGVQSGIIKTTNRDAPYDIRTEWMNGEEFFLPYVGDANLGEDLLDFYLIPHLGTILEIDSKGVITLESSVGFSRPVRVPRTEFEAREPTMPTAPENNLGEVIVK